MAGNYIGVGADGTTALGNGLGVGVLTPGNLIGGTAPHAGNVISGNNGVGVAILTDHTTVQGNLIGTTADGLSPLGNRGGGVVIYNYHGGDTDNHIGGSSPSARNVICDNSSDGVSLYNGASSETIQGNYIGVGSDGVTLMGNHYQGVYVTGSGNTISGNVLSGNGKSGVTLAGTGATGNVVAANLIGVDATGLLQTWATWDPGSFQQRRQPQPNRDRFRRRNSDDRNVIACNNRDGGGIYYDNANVLLKDSGTDSNTISGNWIGLDKTGAATFSPNGGPRGIILVAVPRTTPSGARRSTRATSSRQRAHGRRNRRIGHKRQRDRRQLRGHRLHPHQSDRQQPRDPDVLHGQRRHPDRRDRPQARATSSPATTTMRCSSMYNTTQGTLVEGNLIGTAALIRDVGLGNSANGRPFTARPAAPWLDSTPPTPT